MFAKILHEKYGVNNELIALQQQIEQTIRPQFREIETIKEFNQLKVLSAFQEAKVSDYHFANSTGYGYGDRGRETLDEVYALVFGVEKALVRTQIVSGTHAIALCLFGILRPGDTLVSVTGSPYDTMEEVIGIRGNASGSLRQLGVNYQQLDLTPEGKVDFAGLPSVITPQTKMAMIQRSRGYSWRSALTLEEIKQTIRHIKMLNPETVCFVDNCYGEFVETQEPTEVGADLIAGSLIKNPGGTLAPTGGYIAGKRKYVEMAANRLTAPGIGAKVGASLGVNRLLYQGLFLAPQIVGEALKGAVFTAKLFAELGFEVSPTYDAKRSDIIQGIKFGNAQNLIKFCQGIQQASPIDAFVKPEPWGMPGYEDQVIMAGGTFIQGATLELSADGPLREPYIAYLQGGISYSLVKLGVTIAAQSIMRRQ